MASNKPGDLAGQTIGEYEIISKIGIGGMGVVYEGKHPLIGKRVAVKVLLPNLTNEEELVNRFISEARAVNEIGHRGIVDIFSFGKLPDGASYFVMEFLQGQPFDKMIKARGALPLGEVLNWTEEILDALEAAHSAGIIHRDIKPSNLFLVDTGRGRPYVKLLDFGIAKLGALEGEATPQTRASVIVGTPDYLSPEQARGKPISSRTDLYAVGVLLFEMVTGQRPYRGENALQTMWMHVEATIPRASDVNPDVPPEIDDLIQWAMQKEQDNRPPSAAAMREQVLAIRATLIGEVPTTPGSGRQPSLRTPPPSLSGMKRPEELVTARTPAPRSGRTSQKIKVNPSETKLAPMTAFDGPLPGRSPSSSGKHKVAATAAEPAVSPKSLRIDIDTDLGAEPEPVAPRSKTPLIAVGVVVLLVAVGGLAWVLRGPPEPVKVVDGPIPGSKTPVNKPPDVKPPDVKPPDVKPPDVKPPDVKPPDVKPPDVKPPDVKPPDVKPPDVKPPDVKPPDVKPPDVKPPDVKPPDVKPPDVKPPDVKTPVHKGITQQQLTARLSKLEARLAAKEAESGDQDRVLRQFMAQARKAVDQAVSDGDRRDASKLLDEIASQLR